MQKELGQPAQLFETKLDHVREAPADNGRVELIVRRPAEGERELLNEALLDLELGLVGDRWATRDSRNARPQCTDRGGRHGPRRRPRPKGVT